MKYGVAMFPADDAIQPTELARVVERLGFESLFFPEHSHIPASRQSHFAPESGKLPSYYWHTHDLFVAMSFAAAATSQLRIGSGLCLVAQRDPIWTAKAVASLDQQSGGRVLFGVGAGWNREEMEHHRYEFRTRFSRMRDHVLAMKALWSQDEASYEGRDVGFAGVWAWPKPVQQPHPPILVGGAGPKVLDRVVEYGDGWLAEPADGLEERILALDAQVTAVGREGSVSVTVYGADPKEWERWRLPLVDRCVFWILPESAAAVTRNLEKLAHRLGLEPR